MSLSCIIIDDEPRAVKLLNMLIDQNTEWTVMATCYNGMEALVALKTERADFIFLDINMPQLSGMELAALLPHETKIVFTTAYSEHAAESYNFQTIDYLLKPITVKRFLSAVKKIELYFSNRVEKEKEASHPDFFFVKSGKTLRKILLADTLYFEGEREYVRIVTKNEQMLLYKRLKDIQQQMTFPFVRVHNSYIVNTLFIEKIYDNHIYIGEKQISISDTFKNDFMRFIHRKTL